MKNSEEINLLEKIMKYEATGISYLKSGGSPIIIKKGYGIKLKDINNKIYFDFSSSYGVASIGYSNKKVNKSIKKTLKKINHTMTSTHPTIEYIKLIEKISEKFVFWDAPEVILATSGSEAIDIALKIAKMYTNRNKVLSFKGSFHGQTIGALVATEIGFLREPFIDLLPKDTYFSEYPNSYRTPNDCQEILFSVENNLKKNDFAAVIIEPMQNANGYIVPVKGFLKKLEKICEKYGTLLIFDEIFTGFGRTGYWFLAEEEKLTPDIICIGKSMTGGFPLAACVASKDIMKTFISNGIVPLHGSTYYGNPITCKAVYKNIEILENKDLVKRSKNLGIFFKNKLSDKFLNHQFIGDIRGKGLAIGIEFVKNKTTKEIFPEYASKVNSKLLACGYITLITSLRNANVLAICPPFIVSKNEIERFTKDLEYCLKD